MTPHLNHLGETVLMMGHKIYFYREIWLVIPKLSLSGIAGMLIFLSAKLGYMACTTGKIF